MIKPGLNDHQTGSLASMDEWALETLTRMRKQPVRADSELM